MFVTEQVMFISNFNNGTLIALCIFSGMCGYYVISGVFLERPYELGVLVFSNVVLWLYIILNYFISIKGPFKLVSALHSRARFIKIL